MNKKILILIGAIGALPCLALMAATSTTTAEKQAVQAADKKVFTEADAKKCMEVIGYNIGKGFPIQDMNLSQATIDSFLKGISDAVQQKPCAYDVVKTMPEAQMFMMEKMKVVEEKSKEKMKMETEKAKIEAAESHVKNDAFLAKIKADNKKVKETPEGLVYEIVSEGKGPKPTDKDLVKVHYRGTLIDETEFDSSYKNNTPATFVLGEVIPGFSKGIQFISKGGKIRLYIRPSLGYGDLFRIPGIPNAKAGALLIFDIELLDIQTPPAAATPIVIPPAASSSSTTAKTAPVSSEAKK